jgi:hypothetical protein
MALHVLAYNMKRVLAIIGIRELIKAIAGFLRCFRATLARGLEFLSPEMLFRAV